MDREKLTQFLFYGVLFLMFAPLLNTLCPIVKERGLAGYYAKVKNPTISVKSWVSSDYQKAKERYIKHHFGFRKSLLRYRYQWMYSAYKMSHLYHFVAGKEDYVMDERYLNADLGKDFDAKKIDSVLHKLEVVYQKMKAEQKELLVVIAPSKSQYYREYMPDRYMPDPSAKTNYKAYRQLLASYKLPFIDVNAWFLGMKDTISYPLFPKTGIHYSTYGAALTVDSMIQKWEQLLNKDLPEFYWDSIDWDENLRDEDADIEWAMNLVFPISNFKMAYPRIKIKEEGKYKPKILTIGDSFFWRFYHWKGHQRIYDNSQFLYYNREVYPGKLKRKNYNLSTELAQLDGVCIFINPSEMDRFSWGFIDDLYEHYQYYDPKRIAAIIEHMKNTPTWLAQEKAKAEKRGIDLETMLLLDATYFAKMQQIKGSKPSSKNNKVTKLSSAQKKKVEALIAHIKSKKDWMASIDAKAKERGISIDSMIYLDASYMVLRQEGK